ncbi:hypothetical protein HGA64_03655 [Candidatus Falkowbacteria bacterium]|nr:hypothetical protein [Candidatus Falkowbacteria bacterium]
MEDCPDRGYCCRDFSIMLKDRKMVGGHKRHLSIEEASKLAEALGYPFKAKRYDLANSHWRFYCPKLSEDGSCSIYETRPDICRSYLPKSDKLCCVRMSFGEVVWNFLSLLARACKISAGIR